MPLDEQVTGIFAVPDGYADDVPLARVKEFERGLLQFMRTVHPQVGQAIMREKQLTDEIRMLLDSAIEEYKQTASF